MRKTSSFIKYLKNISKSINNVLEKNLNKLNINNLSNLLKNNKIIFTFVAVFVIFISYLLIPTFYSQLEISKKLKNELENKLDLDFTFSSNIRYNFFPTPHFTTKETTIYSNESEISKIKELKIFISLDNLFSLKDIKIKDIIFENANFNLNKKNYDLFLQLLDNDYKDGNLTIKDSNIFFRYVEDEVLFISKILKTKYYYDHKEYKNLFYSENEVFNIPFSIESFLSDDKNKIFSQINLNLIKLKIDNELSFKNEKKEGKSLLIFNKLKQIAEYNIEKNSFNFHIFDKKEQPNISYKGNFNLKPFYANLEGNSDEINLKYLLDSNALIVQLLKTEIFNNKNIDFKLNINANNVHNNINFRNINLKSKIQEGLIDTDKTTFAWKNYVNFELLESLIYVKDGELVLDGKLKIKIKNYNEIYKYLLTPKNFRNKINEVDLNFSYNFDQKIAALSDIKVDNKINQNINKILNNIILKKENLQNKIYFKNLLNEAIKSYAG